MKRNKAAWIAPFFFLIVTPLFFFLVLGRSIAVSDGKAAGRICGFGVDSEENVYVATESRIKVYRDGEMIRTIKPPPNRTYALYLDKDRLVIGTADTGEGGYYDLEGNELSRGDLSWEGIERQAKERKAMVNGHEYRLRWSIGQSPYYVTRDGEVILRAEPSFFEGLPYWCLLTALIAFFAAFVLAMLSKEKADRERP